MSQNPKPKRPSRANGSRRTSTRKQDEQVVEIIQAHTWGAMTAMVAIPVPFADIGATAGVWGLMIRKIAGVYGYQIDLEDAKRLGSDLFKSVILTTAVWFGSAKTASFLLKFIPGAGTITAYAIDALVAGIGAKGITSRLGAAAALYYKSGKTMAPKNIAEHVKNVAADPQTILRALSAITIGVEMDMDAPDFHSSHDSAA